MGEELTTNRGFGTGCGKGLAFPDPQSLADGVDAFVDYCVDNPIEMQTKKGTFITTSQPMTPPNLADFLGVHRDTLAAYARGEYDEKFPNIDKNKNYSAIMSRVKNKMEKDIAEKALLGIYNERVALAYLNFYFGVVPVTHSVNDNLNRTISSRSSKKDMLQSVTNMLKDEQAGAEDEKNEQNDKIIEVEYTSE